MDKLPVELIIKILNDLRSLKSILNLRFLNKKWKTIIDKFFKIKNLAVSDHRIYVHDFLNSTDLVDCFCLHQNSIYESTLSVLNSRQQFYLNNIRRLLVSGEFTPISLPLFSGEFKTLENLELLKIIVVNAENKIWNLPSLKILKIEYTKFENSHLIFDTPKLQYLSTGLKENEWSKVSFLHPASIKRLETDDFLVQTLEFRCLEFLSVENWVDTHSDENDLLSKLSLLKELYVFNKKKVVQNLLKQKFHLKRNGLNIYYQYIRIDSLEQLNRISNGSTYFYPYSLEGNEIRLLKDNEPYLPMNLHLIASMTFDFLKNYYEDNDKIFEFIDKLKNLAQLYLNGAVSDEKRFCGILQRCKKIRLIEITDKTFLSSEFFNALPDLVPNLDTLIILKDQNINFDFLLKFRKLVNFTLFEQNLTAEFVEELFDKTGIYQVDCKLKKHGKQFSIRRNENEFQIFNERIRSNLKKLSELN